MPISRTYIAPRLVVVDLNTNLFLSTARLCDGYDYRPEPYTLTRLSEATLFTDYRSPKTAIGRLKNRFGGPRCHRWQVIPFAEAIAIDTANQPAHLNCLHSPFPKTITGAMLRGFITTKNGWTKPKVGQLNGKGPLYIAKFASHTSLNHILNENLTHSLYRSCGLCAPRSRVYRDILINGKRDSVLLSEFVYGVPLRDALTKATPNRRETIAREVLKSFPLDSFLNNYDAYQNDNCLVDADGRLWHVDNGSSLKFRATGGPMPWTQNRINPSAADVGMYCIYSGACAWKSPQLGKALMDINEHRIERSWKTFPKTFSNLVRKSIPKVARPPFLMRYAEALDALIAKGETALPKLVPSAFLNDEHQETRYPGYYDGFQW